MSKMSNELTEYLHKCGLSSGRIAKCDGATRMYHDLGLYGDIAEAYMEVLVDKYDVDLQGFEFDKFFPAEFPGGDGFWGGLLSIIPFAGYLDRRRRDFLPLTMGMLETLLRAKRWSAVEVTIGGLDKPSG